MKSFHAVVSNLSLKKLCRVNDSGLSVTQSLGSVGYGFRVERCNRLAKSGGRRVQGWTERGEGGNHIMDIMDIMDIMHARHTKLRYGCHFWDLLLQ